MTDTELSLSYGMHCMEIWGDNRPADKIIRTPGLVLHVISKPLDGAGGDVHYVSVCGGGIVTRILLADVSGHGSPAAELALDLRKLIRKFINTKSQRRLVSHLNEHMQTWLTDGNFATLLVATYLASTKRLTLCNAGHPRPLLFRASTGTWSFLNATTTSFSGRSDLPLGAYDGTLYSQCSTQLDAGDRVVLYTDLLIETHDRLGNALGEAGVLDIVRSLPMDGQLVARNLLDAIVSNPGVDSPSDDLTILEFCHNGGGAQPPSLTEKLRIYGQVFKLIAT